MFLQVTAAWHAQSLSSTQNCVSALGPERELPTELRESWDWWGGAGGSGGEPFYALRSSQHSLSLIDGCVVLPPLSFSSLSLARHPSCTSRSSPVTIQPAITLNSCSAFWDSASFPSLLYPASLVGYFPSGFFVMHHFHCELNNYFTFHNRKK